MLNQEFLFSSPVYKVHVPEFINNIKIIGANCFTNVQKNEIYPVEMSTGLPDDPSLQQFYSFVLNAGWDILNSQGYDMQNFKTYFSDIWIQNHYKGSSMEKHTHGNGVQLVGFYFLDAPENSSSLVFHDPRSAKVILDLPAQNTNDVTLATKDVFYKPQAGDLFLVNAYLPHSITRNSSENMLSLVHINIIVKESSHNVEVI